MSSSCFKTGEGKKVKVMALTLTLIFSTVVLGFAGASHKPARSENWLEIKNGIYTLHLGGSYYDMGYAHGMLLRGQVREVVDAYIDYAERHGLTFVEQLELYEKAESSIPQGYRDEMEGLAHGSGVDLEKIHAIHAIPMEFHCSGLLAYGEATVDGGLYHTRSLDYSLNIQDPQTGRKLQENSMITVYEPDGGLAWLNVGWAGWIGCLGGMNEAGISVGEMGSSSDDETFNGLPMVFRLRRVMEETMCLSQALAIMQENRTCGYNFLVGDSRTGDARAVEQTAHGFYAGAWDDEVEGRYPHWQIMGVVRRTNHFISDLSQTQRQHQLSLEEISAIRQFLLLRGGDLGLDVGDIEYLCDKFDYRDDGRLPHLHFVSYALQSTSLEKSSGGIDGEAIGEVMRRSYRVFNDFIELAGSSVDSLHQLVFAPLSGDFWVSNAGRESSAYMEPLYHFNFYELMSGPPS